MIAASQALMAKWTHAVSSGSSGVAVPVPWLVKWYGPGWLFIVRVEATTSSVALDMARSLLAAGQLRNAQSARATRLFPKREKILTK